jgi:coenzyme F420-0:L-glutamate ligase / coenzyme F420-1:gamma-L-glutamate ligase
MSELRFRSLGALPEIRPGDDLPTLLAQLVPPGDGILVVAQKIVSKAEGRIVALDDVTPGPAALKLAAEVDKDPRQVELVLRETRRIVRQATGILICETRHGLVCANAGVDLSNAPGPDVAILLPLDPDASARAIQQKLGRGRGVVISDTFGRPWREGLVDVAIGVAGFHPLRDYVGSADRAGRVLRVTVMALADQLAAAAGILMEKDSGRPCVWIEGVHPEGSGRLADLLRDPSRDLFR